MLKYPKITFVFVLFLLALSSFSFAEDSVTITTYYPSPYGSYNQLTTYSDTYLATNTDGNVGIGTSSPGAKLEVAGQVKITGGIPGTGKVLTSDADGLATWSSVASVAYVGVTPGTYNGLQVGGYNGGDNKCNAAFSGSRMCTTSDFAYGRPSADGWFNVFLPLYRAGIGVSHALDCSAWSRSEDIIYGIIWLAGSGYSGFVSCNTSQKILCCR